MGLICNDYCKLSGISASIQTFFIALLGWLAGLMGMRLVDSDAALLPAGCRAIPAGHFNFDPAMAELLGIPKAIIFQRIQAWIDHNRRAGRNIRDGQAWSYNSYSQWTADIRLYHQKTIEKHIREMEVLGILKGEQLEQRDGIQTKWYSSPLGLSDGVSQMLLWPESGTPMGGAQVSADSSRNKPAKHKPSANKRQSTTPAARGYGAVNVGAVATFDIPIGELGEGKSETPELPEIHDEHEVYAFEGSPTRTSEKTLTPVPPPPLPDDVPTEEETVSVERTEDAPALPDEIVEFFDGCAQSDLAAMVSAYGLDTLQNARRYALDPSRRLDNPPGFVRAQLAKGWRPPAAPKTESDANAGETISERIEHLEYLANQEDLLPLNRDFYRREAAELRAQLAEGGRP